MKFDLRTVSREDSLRLQDRRDVVDDRSVMRHVVESVERNDGVEERAGSQLRRETHLRVAYDRRDAAQGHRACSASAPITSAMAATTVEAFFSASMSSETPAELMVESVAKLRGDGSSGAASKFVVSQ